MIRRRAEHSSDKNQFDEVTYLLCKAIVVEINLYRISTVLYLRKCRSGTQAHSQSASQSIDHFITFVTFLTIPFFLKCSTVKL